MNDAPKSRRLGGGDPEKPVSFGGSAVFPLIDWSTDRQSHKTEMPRRLIGRDGMRGRSKRA